MKVGVDEITGIEGCARRVPGIAPSTDAKCHGARRASWRSAAASEINVIGCTVEEATERVDKFLDEAALANRHSVRIIHGHGTGALRKGLAAVSSLQAPLGPKGPITFEAEELRR